MYSDEKKVQDIKRCKGRFILATNELDTIKLEDRAVLAVYKEQAKTERGFQFIKDDAFEVDSIFLKKPSRITALMVIMTLCLMVYALAQHHIRAELAKHNDTVLNQLKKPITKPSMKWICRLFYGIHIVLLSRTDSAGVANLNEQHRSIIRYFGPFAVKVYGLQPG